MKLPSHERRIEDREGWEVMDAGLARAVTGFGPRLEAAFAIGSLAHGGFARAASDVDMALILSELTPLDGALVQEIGAAVKTMVASPLAHRLSVFWSTWSSLEAGQGQAHPTRPESRPS
jgi:hypothetical protein